MKPTDESALGSRLISQNHVAGPGGRQNWFHQSVCLEVVWLALSDDLRTLLAAHVAPKVVLDSEAAIALINQSPTTAWQDTNDALSQCKYVAFRNEPSRIQHGKQLD